MTPVEDYKPQTLSCKHIITPAINHMADFRLSVNKQPQKQGDKGGYGCRPSTGRLAGWQADRQAGTSSNHSN